jgi:hypothetical protein
MMLATRETAVKRIKPKKVHLGRERASFLRLGSVERLAIEVGSVSSGWIGGS